MLPKVKVLKQEIWNKKLFKDSWWHYFKALFDIELYPYQLEIVHDILKHKKKRLVITASTRAGKSYVVAMTAVVYSLLHPGTKVYLIAPTYKQAQIIMEYIYDFTTHNKYILEQTIMSTAQRMEKLGKKMTFDHITFKSGASIRILSGEGGGDRLLGHGVGKEGGIVIVDESPLIEDSTFNSRIMRMLGDNPDAQLVEIGNPININHFFKHFNDDGFSNRQISWKECVKYGRLSQEFIEEQYNLCTPGEFKILYDAEFVEELQRYYPTQLIHDRLHSDTISYEQLENCNVRIGVDFGRKRDASAVSICIKDYLVSKQIELLIWKGMPLPEQRLRLERIFQTLKDNGCTIEARLDMTGMGWAITEELQRKWPAEVIGVNFASKIALPVLNSGTGQQRMKEKVVPVIALNLKQLMLKKEIYLYNHPELVADLEEIPEDLELEKTERGHYDCFIATGLSALPDNFSAPMNDLIIQKSSYHAGSSVVQKFLRERRKQLS